KFNEGEKVKAFVTLKDFDPDMNIVMCTKNGLVKKTSLMAYSNPRSNGIIAINLNEDDELIDARISGAGDHILLGTRFGYNNRFDEALVRSVGRNSKGVKGISLRDRDYVISMVVISTDMMEMPEDEAPTLLAISENGYGKRSPISAYPVNLHRGGKGVITMKTSARNGQMAALMLVTDEDDLMIITSSGMIIRQTVKEIKVISRNTLGVRLINLASKDQVKDITCVPPENDDEEKLDKEVENLKKAPKKAPVAPVEASEWDSNEDLEEPEDISLNEDSEDTED
ncbi:MAG: DNA gyrase C-terminal beta-propeller domain-containing protein, partial [Candidatus Cloacimonetes bacterium]|nr:DNA gyrase C-terminal beta-propeller domain-containing protein [Candidatus Cloacimonadota bacterium]